jgi:hypothetical protein
MKLAMKGFWRSALILLQPVIIYINTVRSPCDIMIYRTTERIFSKWTFRGKLRFGTDGSLLYSLISSQKFILTEKLSSKIDGDAFVGNHGNCMNYIGFFRPAMVAVETLHSSGYYWR